MQLHRMENREKGGLTTFGSYWGKGEVSSEAKFILMNEDNSNVPVQSRITAYWPDGTVKWAAHTANSDGMSELITVETVLKDHRNKETNSTLSEEGNKQEIIERDTKQAGGNDNTDILITEEKDSLFVQAGTTSVRIWNKGTKLFEQFYTSECKAVEKAELVALLEERSIEDDVAIKREVPYLGVIKETKIEECGPLRCVIKITGIHQHAITKREVLPFILRMTIGKNQSEIVFTHTFLYDGDENKDFLKGIGVRFYRQMKGESYNRHIKFGTDYGCFHESLAMLLTWHPRVPISIYESQMKGEVLRLNEKDTPEAIQAKEHIPIWGEYVLCQDSATHYVVKKKISKEECCYIEGLHGIKAKGTVAVSDEEGGFAIGLKDFWQKYPSTYQVKDLDNEEASATVWFWSPEVEAMDFRHYTTTGYSQTYYEGFDEMGATPYGIANTNEIRLTAIATGIPSDEWMERFFKQVQKPCVYIASPEYYHELGAFGIWSLRKRENEAQVWLEDQLEKGLEFYLEEIKVRNWYGLFSYGDVMHTYDKIRHCWRYDMGGYAWQNTELVPTLWLWYSFLRTGREDIFTMAEAMVRHCSEVDVYHLGPYKGIGSRHNVRHWGCSCKEARIAMAGHHRFYYYLTGDYRLGDIFDEVKDGDSALLELDPRRHFFHKEEMVYKTHARTGPDWSTFTSNWMTEWERTQNQAYKEKILTGIQDLKNAPLRLISGSDFEYDPESSHLRYIGEQATGGFHLIICMGAPQVWFELVQLLEDEEWNQMLADFGRFYYMDHEEQMAFTNGLIKDRISTFPYMAAAMAAYGATYYQDKELAKKVWKELKECLSTEAKNSVFAINSVYHAGNQEILQEMSSVSTNVMSQWCLNVIVALDLIPEELPESFFGG